MASAKSTGRNVLAGDNFKLASKRRNLRGEPFLLVEAHIGFELQHEMLPDAQHLKMLDGNLRFRKGSVDGGHCCFKILRGETKNHAAGLQAERIFQPTDDDEEHQDQQA